MIPNACVVEVIERVPDADVAIVAARVGERLGMPPERVRQLIDGRTGPITRALRPEKADAIAQTFEAVGVRVVIRAADADEIEEARAGGAAAQSAKSPGEAPTEAPAAVPAEAPAEATGRFEQDAPSGVADEPTVDAEPELEPEPEPAWQPEPEPEPEPELDPEPEPEWEPEPEPELEREPEPEPEPEPVWEADSELDDGPEHEGEPAFDVADEPDHVSYLDPHPEVDRYAASPTDDDLVPGPEAPSEQGLAREVAYIFATGEAPAWRGEHVDLDTPGPDEEGWTDDPPAAGGPGGVLDVADDDAYDEPFEEPFEDASDDGDGHEARGEVARAEGRNAPDAFPPVGGWEAEGAGAWSTRRAAADAADGGSERSDVPTFAIGRASRRQRDERTQSGAFDEPMPPEAPAIAVPSDDDEVPTAAFEEAPLAAPRSVPTAWRGLGGAEAGPARPPSARLPRRSEPIAEPRFVFDEPPVRRRAVMLAALGVAVVLFVLAQWWVASRAGAAGVDPFDAYRRGEFAAARAVWDAEAAAGDPSARFMLGYLAEAGLGAPWSARTAAGWYRAAADVGHAEAMWRLARLYEVGLGVGPDTLEARRWYRAAAQAGHAEAAFAWGRVVLHDAGVALGAGAAPQVAAATAAEAATAFERATELGWHEAAPYAAAFSALVVEGP